MMKGIRYLKPLISLGKVCFPSKRLIQFSAAHTWGGKTLKFEIDKTLNIQQRSIHQLEGKNLENTVSSFGFTSEEIMNSLKSNPELMKYPTQKFQNAVTALLQQGMAASDITQIFLSVPHIVEVNINDLNRTINKWRELGLDEEKMFRTFRNSPFLLLLTPEYIDNRLRQIIRELFTNADVAMLLQNMPSIFFSGWDIVMKKMYYIQAHMGFTQIQITRTSALEHSLLHIKTRHMFISLSGVFKTRDPKKKILRNPSLRFIVDSRDQDFVKKCCVSLDSYHVFRDIMAAKEMEDEEADSE